MEKTEIESRINDWIYAPTAQQLKIDSMEDDEIIDLDAISWGSNEDTWLYSSSNSSGLTVDSPDSEFSKDKSSIMGYIETPVNGNSNDSSMLSSSGLIDINNESLFGISNVMSPHAFDNFVEKSPMSESELKKVVRTNMLKSVLAKQLLKENAPGIEKDFKSDDKSVYDTYRKEKVDDHTILHSLENRPFDGDDYGKSSAVNGKRTTHGVTAETNVEETLELAALLRSVELDDDLDSSAMMTTFRRPATATTVRSPRRFAENEENRPCRVPPLGQSTPLLANRHARNSASEARFLHSELNKNNVMNVSYTCSNTLNTTFSKSSEDVLSTAFDIEDEDEVESIASSGSSCRRQFTMDSIERMAEAQERRLRKMSYYGESSRSSEVSSSSESISTVSLSSSNEGQINMNGVESKAKPMPRKFATYLKPTTVVNNPRNVKSAPNGAKPVINSKPSALKKPAESVIEPKSNTTEVIGKDSKLNTTIDTSSRLNSTVKPKFLSKMAVPSPVSAVKYTSKNEQNARNSMINVKSSIRPSLREPMVVTKDIKSKDNAEVKASIKANGIAPSSHIPRPSSRIPTRRTSVSCTRYSTSSAVNKH